MSIVLRPNATAVYSFLSYIISQQENPDFTANKKVLDCGAGGVLPPLAVFHENGFDTYGIELSEEQLSLAQDYCKKEGYPISITQGDMREIPFEDSSFDIVYEHFSMCHLTKADTRIAIDEMKRVLKPGGYCFLGFISEDTWPRIGNEVSPGEFKAEEHGEITNHSFFGDDETDEMVFDWKVLKKEKKTRWSKQYWDDLSKEDWLAIFDSGVDGYNKQEWENLYSTRAKLACYSHIYFVLTK